MIDTLHLGHLRHEGVDGRVDALLVYDGQLLAEVVEVGPVHFEGEIGDHA